MERNERAVARWPLLVGALLGVSVAVSGLLRVGVAQPSLPDDAAAVVNGVAVGRSDLERALGAARADRTATADEAALRQRVLDRLVDQELLVQRGLALGLVEKDPQVRADLAQATIDLLVARGELSDPPGDQELRAYYLDQSERFRRPSLSKVRWLTIERRAGDDDVALEAYARALRARWLAGEIVEHEARPPVPLPDGWLPEPKLADYLGAVLARAVAELAPGEVSAPIATAEGLHLLWLVDRRAGELPAFEQIESDVRAALLRSAGERRLYEFLAEARRSADIAVAEAL